MKVALSKFTAANFTKLRYMRPEVQRLFTEFFCRIAMAGIYFRIPDDGGKRTTEEQLDQYRKGRPWVAGYDPKRHNVPPVTDVKCPYSWHCHGLAVDIAPLTRLSTLLYSVWYGETPFNTIARIAKELGITWGYAIWGQDKPHFHYSGGLTLEQVIAGTSLPVPQFTPAEKPKVLQRALVRLEVPLP